MGDDSNKRLLVALSLCMLIAVSFNYFFAPPPQKIPDKSEVTKHADKAATNGRPSAVVPDTDADSVEAEPADTTPKDTPEETAMVSSPLWGGTLTTEGASLKSLVLRSTRYMEDRDGKTVPVDLVNVKEGPYPLEVDFGPLKPKGGWKIEESSDRSVVFVSRDEVARIEKRFDFDPGSHLAKMSVSVENLTEEPIDEKIYVRLRGWKDPESSSASGAYARVWEPACYVNGELLKSDDIKDEDSLGEVLWTGVGDKYFLLATIPLEEKGDRRCVTEAEDDGRFEVALELSERQVPAGEKMKHEFLVYAGPKVLADLDAVMAGKMSPRLGESVDFWGLDVLCRPMLWLLKRCHSLTGNWGFAIILLTLIVKVATLPWTTKSMRQMKQMQKFQPEIKKMQEKYKEDKERLNKEIMALYKRHKLNPLGGCLPMLLQMPIWISLYGTLAASIELYRSPFVFWIQDLATPDKFYVLPVVLGAASFGQARFSGSAPADPQQRFMTIYLFPGMFFVFACMAPSGLALYWLVNTLLTIVHQLLMNRGKAAQASPAAA